MPDVTSEVDELIRDAELVRAYAARAGLLTDDRLSQAITAAHEATRSGASPDIPALAIALSAAVKTISPVTLIDLRKGRSPFDATSETAATHLQTLLSVFSIALVGLIAFYMVTLQREQDALIQIEKVADLRAIEKLGALRRMAQHEGVFENADVKYDNYPQKLFELLQLQEKVTSAYHVIYQAKDTPIVPFQHSFSSAWTWLKTAFSRSRDGNTARAVPVVHVAGNSDSTPEANTADQCEVEPEKLVKTNSWLGKVSLDTRADFCFSSMALGSAFMTNQPLSYHVLEFKERVAVKSGWILPFLYGLLGASIYLMRSQLSTRTATITSMPAFLRIALGGVAGIVVGWFGATGNAASSTVVASSLPFALAFLAGFSIDVLFSLLDRFNRVITEQTKPKGVD